MKNILVKIWLAAFVLTAVFAVSAGITGNENAAEKAGVMSVVAFAGAGFAAAPKMSESRLGLQWTRTEETLLDYLSQKSDPGAKRKFLNGELRFVDKVLYRALQIDGFSGIQKIWDNTVSKSAGVTNVDKAKLDKDVHVCVDSILIEAINTGGSGTTAILAGYDSVVTSWGAGLACAEITILQDDNVILLDHPTYTCGSPADSQMGKGFADSYKLKTPFIIEGDKTFEVRINFPADPGAATNTDFMRLSLFGVGTRKRGLI